MTNKLKNIVLASGFLSKLYFSFLRLKHLSVVKEIQRRNKLSLLSYQELAQPLKLYPYFDIKDNNIYGTGNVLKQARLGLNLEECLVEHGLIFGDLVQEHNAVTFAKKIVTFSKYREEKIVKKIEKDVICIGPYIKYAKSILTPFAFEDLKNKLKRTLLVFPSHSNDTTVVDFNNQLFMKKIEDLSKSFDSVLICLYWKDILLGRAEEYEKMGYYVTCAGHSYDFNFLKRLRAIIELSDFTMSNNVGTHIGYAVCLGKGHFIFQQQISKKEDPKSSEAKQRGDQEWSSYASDVGKVVEAFKEIQFFPSFEQQQIIKKYWGEF